MQCVCVSSHPHPPTPDPSAAAPACTGGTGGETGCRREERSNHMVETFMAGIRPWSCTVSGITSPALHLLLELFPARRPPLKKSVSCSAGCQNNGHSGGRKFWFFFAFFFFFWWGGGGGGARNNRQFYTNKYRK